MMNVLILGLNASRPAPCAVRKLARIQRGRMAPPHFSISCFSGDSVYIDIYIYIYTKIVYFINLFKVINSVQFSVFNTILRRILFLIFKTHSLTAMYIRKTKPNTN